MTPAAPAEEQPVTKRAGATQAARVPWTRSWRLAAGFLLLAAAMPVLVVLAGRSKEPREKAAGASTGATTVAVMSAAPEQAMPNGFVMPKATASTTAAPSATAAPAPSAQADAGARKPAGADVRELPPHEDDPYDEPKHPPAKSKQPPMIF
jgi:hypothetical protein